MLPNIQLYTQLPRGVIAPDDPAPAKIYSNSISFIFIALSQN
jgi:hypothetical protein